MNETGNDIQIESYQKNLRDYIYYSSIFPENEKKILQLELEPGYVSFAMVQTLINMLSLAEKSFAKLGYPSYYQEFANAVEMLIEDHKNAKVKRKMLLN